MSYHHFTTFERGRIQELLSLGYSHRSIARKLNRHHSSIDREIRRNLTCTGYTGESAQSASPTSLNTIWCPAALSLPLKSVSFGT